MTDSRLEMKRRTLLMTSAAMAASVLMPERVFAQATPRRGGVFAVHYGAEQRQLNPSLQASTGVYIIGGKIQEPLVDLDANGNPIGVLAERWETTPDGKTITFHLRRGIRWPGSARHWGAVALTGFLIQVVYFGLAWMAMKQGMNAGTAAIIMALQPILVAAATARGGAARPWLRAGLALGFGGVLVTVLSGSGLGPSPVSGVLMAIAALLGITIATVFEKKHGMKTDPAVGGVVQYVTGFAILLPLAAVTETMVIDWQPEFLLAMAYLVLANSIVSIGLYIALIQRGDATAISSLLYLVPPLAMLIAWLVLGEAFTPMALFGLALAAAGIWCVNRPARG